MSQFCQAQVQFITLKGAPLDTVNWKFRGIARLGTTVGSNLSNSELILCPKSPTFSSGLVYYNKPLKINPTCNQWTANFEFRIFDGTTADGLAFFFLENPENQGADGSNLGIPTATSGIVVAMDTYENCCSQGFACPNNNNPEIQVRVLSPTVNYSECDTTHGTQIHNIPKIRSASYQKMSIFYKNDSIYVSLNSIPFIQFYAPLDINGYFGFSAATGGNVDNHSVRNIEIIVPRNSLTVDAGRDTTICAGAQIQLGTSSLAGYTYSWTPSTNIDNPSNPNPNFSSTTPGIHRLTLRTDSSKALCYFTDQINIKVEEKPIFTISPHDTLICRGQKIKLPSLINFQTSSVSGKFMQWLPKTGIDTTNNSYPTFSPSSTTTYTLWASNTNSRCWNKDTLRIRLDELPAHVVDVGKDTILCENQTILIKPNTLTPGDRLLWSNGDTSKQILVSSIGKYWLSIKNSNGCNEIIDTINVKPCPPEIQQVPNVFTPNDDGKNDLFFVTTSNVADYTLVIINRWGEKVYISNDKKSTWDAKNVPDGIYS
ncbi:MAG: gliding motility-associated C-terminal domain-containing protein, partial [Cytophagales bacterium]|nr:gliding motility-associated C-terminal domain-containing protein [Cytophagales bacterium]